MNQKSWLLNLSLLKTHPAFRAVFIARFISILSLGLLGVAVPVQIQTMTHSSWLVGLSVTLTGGAMFIGLMIGGVLADRYERKKLILLARGTCGVGFVGLCLNAMLPEPSLMAIYALGLWDGFFASLGVTALLAATPALVGRENLMQAGAITMLTVRLGSVISPMVGGLLLATGDVAWNYGLAAAGTFITTLTLLRLPLLPPPPQPREHPLKSLMAAIRFLFSNPLIGGIALLGGLLTMASAVRVLYPALAGEWQMSAPQIGVLYAAIPLGAACGALTSGKHKTGTLGIERPDGSRRWLWINAKPFFDDESGELRGVVSTLADITLGREHEEQRRLALTVFRNSVAAIVVTDGEERILSVNQAFTEVTGYAAEEIIGQTPRMLGSGVHSREFYQAMWRSISETSAWQGEIWNRRKNGEIYYEQVQISPIRQPDGSITHYLGVKQDITEKRRLAEELDREALKASDRQFKDWLQRAAQSATDDSDRQAIAEVERAYGNFDDLLLAMNLNPLIHSDNDARIVARELLLAHREHLPNFAAAIDALA